MYYSQETIEEIRQNNDIVDIVSSYVPIKQKGNNYFGLCPFHNEKSPSFSVSSDKQIYYCFGCGATGNVYSFVMQMENYDFPEAIKFLAEKIHYQLPDDAALSSAQRSEMVRNSQTKELLFELNKVAARYFYDNLNCDEGALVQKYLDERQISPKIRVKYGLGCCLNKSDSLYKHLLEAGYDLDTILKSGLVLPSKKGSYYDRFFGRLMFPIFDVQNRIVGFGGRILEKGEPKYLNSPETLLFDKSRNLYSINFARRSKSKTFILVEGYMDVIAIFQAGFQNVVASLGTAFNIEHAKLMKKYADTVVILFDSDEAGTKAALRAIPTLTASGLKVRVLQVKDAKDPDDYIKAFGNEAFGRLLNTAESYITFQVKVLKSQYDLNDTDQKVQFILEVAKLLSKLDNAVEQDAYVQEIAKLTNISMDAIKVEIDKLTDKSLAGVRPIVKQSLNYIHQSQKKGKGMEESKKNILYLLAGHYYVSRKVEPFLAPSEMNDDVYEKLLALIYEFHNQQHPIYLAEILNYFETVEAQKKISDVFETFLQYDSDFALEKSVNALLRNIKKFNNEEAVSSITDANELQKLIENKRNIEKLYITITDG